MPGLKKHFSDIRFSGNNATPDELHRYENYYVINPAIGAAAIGSATAGTVSQAITPGIANVVMDYPRNLALVFTGSASVSGTLTITGKDQFGATQTEVIGQAQGTQEAATVEGTKIFAQVSALAVAMGTGVSGTGTASVGYTTVGTSTYFGLPTKIDGTADVLAITWTDESGGAKALGLGTIGAYVDATNHSFRGTETLAGTMTYMAMFRPSYNAENDANNVALTQV